MTLVPKREYLILILGDVLVFALSLWLTLALRYLEIPDVLLLSQHVAPFAILFIVWSLVFFLAGLYGKHTKLFRSRLLPTLVYTQIINIALAALFFFFIPFFGIAPKTVLLIYLLVSSVLITAWRIVLFPRVRRSKKLTGVLIASGPDAKALAEEIGGDTRYPFAFEYVVDTANTPSHEIIQHACRVAEEDNIAFLVVDVNDAALQTALPILYDAAFHKRRFVMVNLMDLYQEVFDRVPLSLVRYEWVLANSTVSPVYDAVKRVIDVIIAALAGALSLVLYPFIMLAIQMDDGGDIFITQERVGRFQKPIHIIKFRSMTGNDKGKYDRNGKSNLSVTRVGKVLRMLRLDELPQLWNVLRGDLSIVGPRPEFPSLAEHYSARIPYYSARYLITPGLTGWAQILHDRHPHHGTDVAATKEKLSYDLYYFQQRSLVLDLYIMFQTIRIVLTARGT
ncbi:MAG TPA: sugar transferase [Candidatus Paceibacterota bacterium]|nr:sugar transferase [Candidatus Paceibacterota bacterium]